MVHSQSAHFTRSDEGYFVNTEMHALRQGFET